MKAYKGFNQDMTCRGFQYEVGKEYETETAKCCESGFHACEAPLDVFLYYAPGTSRYCEVEQSGEISKRGDNTKVASSRIKIGAEIGIPGLVKAQIEYVKSRVTSEIKDENSATAGYGGAATAGDRGAATAGYRGAATAGYRGAATAGEYGAATAGYGGAATAGYGGAATARGSVTVGECGSGLVRGSERDIRIRGGNGAILVLCVENDTNYSIKFYATIVIDGDKYKPNVWYTMCDGEVVEWK